MNILKFWLTSNSPTAETYRQTAPRPELFGGLLALRRPGAPADSEQKEKVETMRTIATEKARVAAARAALEKAQKELAAWGQEHDGLGGTYPLHKQDEYDQLWRHGRRLVNRRDSWERDLTAAEESLALVVSEANDLREAVAHYEGRVGAGGMYDRLIEAEPGQVDFYEAQRRDERDSLEKTRRRLHKLTGSNGTGPGEG